MIENYVLIPMTCPICKVEAFAKVPKLVVRTALTVWNQMGMRSACHDQQWSASPADLARVREYLGPTYGAAPSSATSKARGKRTFAHAKRLP